MTVSPQLIVNAILILLLLVWVGYRQTTWRAVDASRMLRMPAILAIAGLAVLGSGSDLAHLSGLDVAVLLTELILSCGIGALMGLISRFRPMSSEAREAYARRGAGRSAAGTAPSLEARTGWAGLALWAALIAVRIGADVLAAHLGSALAASTGVILLLVAANRAARVLVILRRADRSAVRATAPVASGTY